MHFNISWSENFFKYLRRLVSYHGRIPSICRMRSITHIGMCGCQYGARGFQTTCRSMIQANKKHGCASCSWVSIPTTQWVIIFWFMPYTSLGECRRKRHGYYGCWEESLDITRYILCPCIYSCFRYVSYLYMYFFLGCITCSCIYLGLEETIILTWCGIREPVCTMCLVST